MTEGDGVIAVFVVVGYLLLILGMIFNNGYVMIGATIVLIFSFADYWLSVFANRRLK